MPKPFAPRGRWKALPHSEAPHSSTLIEVASPDEARTIYWSPKSGEVFSYTEGYGGYWEILEPA